VHCAWKQELREKGRRRRRRRQRSATDEAAAALETLPQATVAEEAATSPLERLPPKVAVKKKQQPRFRWRA